MPILLQVQNLAKEYGGEKIFSGLSFAIGDKQKIGVIGRNGAGKSTLFRIITKEEEADEGEIIIHDTTKIGYLKQHDDWNKDETALEYLQRLSAQPEWRARQVASKFELRDDKLAQTADSLSGGWRMRLKLSGMLLQEPNLFLLDEPSNYLDLNTVMLLENYLRSYNGSFLIISHDREFLKRSCKETIEISKTGCYHYPGPIEPYLSFKAEKLATLIKANESLERQQEHWQEFIDRFRSKASKAKQAQAMIRKISKLEQKRVKVETEAGLQRINIPAVAKKNNFVLKTNNLSIGYGKQVVVEDIDLDLRAGEKLAILGLNGQGKSTLLKTLNGTINPLQGSYHWSSGSRLASHSQEEMEKMNPLEQAGDYLRRVAAPDIKTEAVLKMAGDFLFKDEELKKSISVLSGGEKSRLLLAGILLSKPDVLLLDEVTCHLDFETSEALATALKKYQGTVLFASHDRAFSQKIATAILEIDEGLAKRRHEDYVDYLRHLERRLRANQKEQENSSSYVSTEKKISRVRYLENKQRQKKIQSLEKELEKMQAHKQELLNYFLENYQEYNAQKNQELEDINRGIKDKEEYWLRLISEVEASQ